MYYLGRVVLGLDEATFWKSTLRKLTALWRQHQRYHEAEPSGEELQGFIDQVL
ncbi:MAG: hypothetical protein ACYCVD_07650 [Desulfitobacteriaceae bacterium]